MHEASGDLQTIAHSHCLYRTVGIKFLHMKPQKETSHPWYATVLQPLIKVKCNFINGIENWWQTQHQRRRLVWICKEVQKTKHLHVHDHFLLLYVIVKMRVKRTRRNTLTLNQGQTLRSLRHGCLPYQENLSWYSKRVSKASLHQEDFPQTVQNQEASEISRC